MVDLMRLIPSEPEAFSAFVTKSRCLISDLTRRTIPADLGEIAAAVLVADCDGLARLRRPFLTLYTRARCQSRKTLVPRKASVQPLAAARACLRDVDARSVDLTGASLRETFFIDTDLDQATLDGIDAEISIVVVRTRGRSWVVGGLVRPVSNDPPRTRNRSTPWG